MYNDANINKGACGRVRLTAEKIEKDFGDKKVLRGVSVLAEGGKAIGVLGRNGAGKTTLIRIIMGVFPADNGEILIDGRKINRNDVKFGYLPEERGLYPKKPILEQLIYFAALRGMKTQEAKASARRLLERLEMSEYESKKLDTLSKGNQQKIQLAASLLCDPDIVILDEPFSGLDPVNAMLLKDIVKDLINDGKIVMFSSHQMSYVEEFCNDIAIINRGEIVLSGAIKEIKRNYDRSKIIVSGPEPEKITEFSRERLPGIALSAETREGDAAVKLISPDMKNAMISALAASGIEIDSISVFEPSLNDIFVEYTEDAI